MFQSSISLSCNLRADRVYKPSTNDKTAIPPRLNPRCEQTCGQDIAGLHTINIKLQLFPMIMITINHQFFSFFSFYSFNLLRCSVYRNLFSNFHISNNSIKLSISRYFFYLADFYVNIWAESAVLLGKFENQLFLFYQSRENAKLTKLLRTLFENVLPLFFYLKAYFRINDLNWIFFQTRENTNVDCRLAEWKPLKKNPATSHDFSFEM